MSEQTKPGLTSGEVNGSAKLTEANVLYIRASAEKTIELAARFGVSATTIQSARSGKYWKHAGLTTGGEFREHLWMPVPWSGCWIWTGAVTKNKGEERPLLNIANKNRNAAREFYKHYRGPIGFGLCVCHTCDNTLCVNPDHLFTGTHGDNMRDMVRKGRHASQRKAGATC